MSENVRGSELLKRRYTADDLQRLLSLSEMDGVELVEYFPIGIVDPDGGWGVLRVQPDTLSALISAFLTHEKFPSIKIFPRGVPAWEEFDVVFEAGAQRG